MTIHATQDTDVDVTEDKIIDKAAPIELVEEELRQLFHGSAGYAAFLDRNGVTEQQVQQLMSELPSVSPDEDIDSVFMLAPSVLIHGTGVSSKRPIKKGETFLAAHKLKRTILARYVNHSDLPNAIMLLDGPNEIKMQAIKDIPAGDEITTDYNHTMALVMSLNKESNT